MSPMGGYTPAAATGCGRFKMADILREMKKFFSDLGLHLELGIKDSNLGACTGEWITPDDERKLVSVNPTDGEPIASIIQADDAAYEKVMAAATEAFEDWRMIPAPQRGEVVRQISARASQVQGPLGQSDCLGNGQDPQRGSGRSPGDDRHLRLRRRTLAPAVWPHDARERPRHRMYEQWHPLGVVGIITAFNFPVAVWAWNAIIAAVCGDTMVWKPSSQDPADRDCGAAHLQSRDEAHTICQGVFDS